MYSPWEDIKYGSRRRTDVWKMGQLLKNKKGMYKVRARLDRLVYNRTGKLMISCLTCKVFVSCWLVGWLVGWWVGGWIRSINGSVSQEGEVEPFRAISIDPKT